MIVASVGIQDSRQSGDDCAGPFVLNSRVEVPSELKNYQHPKYVAALHDSYLTAFCDRILSTPRNLNIPKEARRTVDVFDSSKFDDLSD